MPTKMIQNLDKHELPQTLSCYYFFGYNAYTNLKHERTWVSCSWLCLDFFYCFCPEATFQLPGVRAVTTNVTNIFESHEVIKNPFLMNMKNQAPQENTLRIPVGQDRNRRDHLLLCMCLLLLFHTSLLRRVLSMLLAFKARHVSRAGLPNSLQIYGL